MSKQFNGHKNWNHWNVSLWINNDEGFYRQAKELIRTYGCRDVAAAVMAKELKGQKTPDGAPYSKTTIAARMVGM